MSTKRSITNIQIIKNSKKIGNPFNMGDDSLWAINKILGTEDNFVFDDTMEGLQKLTEKYPWESQLNISAYADAFWGLTNYRKHVVTGTSDDVYLVRIEKLCNFLKDAYGDFVVKDNSWIDGDSFKEAIGKNLFEFLNRNDVVFSDDVYLKHKREDGKDFYKANTLAIDAGAAANQLLFIPLLNSNNFSTFLSNVGDASFNHYATALGEYNPRHKSDVTIVKDKGNHHKVFIAFEETHKNMTALIVDPDSSSFDGLGYLLNPKNIISLMESEMEIEKLVKRIKTEPLYEIKPMAVVKTGGNIVFTGVKNNKNFASFCSGKKIANTLKMINKRYDEVNFSVPDFAFIPGNKATVVISDKASKKLLSVLSFSTAICHSSSGGENERKMLQDVEEHINMFKEFGFLGK